MLCSGGGITDFEFNKNISQEFLRPVAVGRISVKEMCKEALFLVKPSQQEGELLFDR